MNNRAFASGFIVLIITIFVLIVAYISTMYAYDLLRDQAILTANNVNNTLADGVMNALAWADTIYVKVPLMILFGALIYAILNAMRREPREYQR